MKKLITILFLVPILCFAQDSTVITNLQLRASTIKTLAVLAKISEDTSIARVFESWQSEFKASSPSDNSNVTIPSAKTVVVAWMYEQLLALPSGRIRIKDHTSDFVTSIQSKRNTNTYLNSLCDKLEAIYTEQETRAGLAAAAFLTQ